MSLQLSAVLNSDDACVVLAGPYRRTMADPAGASLRARCDMVRRAGCNSADTGTRGSACSQSAVDQDSEQRAITAARVFEASVDQRGQIVPGQLVRLEGLMDDGPEALAGNQSLPEAICGRSSYDPDAAGSQPRSRAHSLETAATPATAGVVSRQPRISAGNPRRRWDAPIRERQDARPDSSALEHFRATDTQ